MSRTARAFTIIELLTVIAIIAILAGLVLPAMSRARDQGRTTTCQTRLRQFAAAWEMYADENDNVLVPGRMYNKEQKGPSHKDNWYDVGNGYKYRPRWPATLGPYIGVYAFNEPLTEKKEGQEPDRQDYDSDVYQCPAVSDWIDERNYAYGYNHQFLGNGRQTADRFHNFPVYRHRIKDTGGTVVFADSMGTAAGYSKYGRGPYIPDDDIDNVDNMMGNHGWSLDPPRLTDDCDRGTGEEDEDSPRTAVDPRHQGKANVVFADGHGATMTPYELGYRMNVKGCYVDYDPEDECEEEEAGGVTSAHGGDGQGTYSAWYLGALDSDDDIDGAHNRLFSGTGRDDDPPEIPQASGE